MNYPECEKLSSSRKESTTIMNFLFYLEDESIKLAKYDEQESLRYFQCTNQNLMEKFLGIDSKKIEQERQHMLDNF